MPYPIAQDQLNKLGAKLAEYYEEAWQAGIKGLFDNMARSRMGVVTGYLDVASDTFANLRKKSSDSFFTTFRPALKQQVNLYLANRSDVANDLVAIGESVINNIASKIPVPYVGTALSAISAFAAGKTREELHRRSIAEADRQLAAHGGANPQKLFTTDTEAQEFVKTSIDQYKTICKFIETLPKRPASFDDAVTFPGAAFKVQAAASHLNVALLAISEYVAAMQDRLAEIQKVSKEYVQTVRTQMPAAAKVVLDAAYDQGKARGVQDVARKKYAAAPEPRMDAARIANAGGATQLAAYVAHATAKGYYDAGNTGPIPGSGSFMTRPRSGAVSAPPLPFRK